VDAPATLVMKRQRKPSPHPPSNARVAHVVWTDGVTHVRWLCCGCYHGVLVRSATPAGYCPWVELVDESTQHKYWYNHDTGAAQWVCPEELAAEEDDPFWEDEPEAALVRLFVWPHFRATSACLCFPTITLFYRGAIPCRKL